MAEPAAVPGAYRVPAAPATAEIKEKGSRFLAVVRPAVTAADCQRALAELGREHRGATHLCWAWRLGWPPRERSSDAGEPHGTAGVPILQALRGGGLSDALAVVARWFGGTKLGKGGLARAYAAAARAAVDALATAERLPVMLVELEAGFEQLGGVQRLVQPPAVEIAEESYGETARLVLRVQLAHSRQLLEALAALGLQRVEVRQPAN